jgi:hypothetical protein
LGEGLGEECRKSIALLGEGLGEIFGEVEGDLCHGTKVGETDVFILNHCRREGR